ncbi:transcriptional regulator GcvA [Mesorhizobium sp. AD1-1]|uniref:transcriptional regulator GcvA n=1 Tax=Mesorhizobium sp. AD1-1 TaxID=2876621 RepID=UPI001CCDF3F9|nr:transcriptional regulator GcvA [Mesorhizobium sp. AD1-1]MBZ9719190.1 transcriptional regulator GcvA [Mesorhizobium sp. AD1-1]
MFPHPSSRREGINRQLSFVRLNLCWQTMKIQSWDEVISPMSNHRPPLKALITFECAARHLSFKNAAEELSVTPSAVSHQIAALEEHLGVRLFARLTRELQLTPEGTNYLALVGDALEQIDDATSLIMRTPAKDVLRVQTSPSFGPNWLLPRLDGFLSQNPTLDVRIVATYEPADFHASRLDMAIWYGFGNFPNCYTEPLIVDRYQAYCSPDLLKRVGGLSDPSDLSKMTLIHTERNLITWRAWLQSMGISGVDSRRGIRLDPSHLAIDAAVSGMGVVLESDVLVADLVRDGKLVAPFSHLVTSKLAYYVVYPLQNGQLLRVQLFHAWLKSMLPPIENGPLPS